MSGEVRRREIGSIGTPPTAPAPTVPDNAGLREEIRERLGRYWLREVPEWAVDEIANLPALAALLAERDDLAAKVAAVEAALAEGMGLGIYASRLRRALGEPT